MSSQPSTLTEDQQAVLRSLRAGPASPVAIWEQARIRAADRPGLLKGLVELGLVRQDNQPPAWPTHELTRAGWRELAEGGQVVGLGSRVRVQTTECGACTEEQWTVVPALQADARLRRISVDSPLARTLFGHRAGDEVVFEGALTSWTLRLLSVDSNGPSEEASG